MEINQKNSTETTKFKFAETFLDYEFQSKEGTKIKRKIGWGKLPTTVGDNLITEPDNWLSWSGFFMPMMALLFILTKHGRNPWETFIICGGMGAIVFACLYLTKGLRARQFSISYIDDQTNLIILKDKNYGRILDAINEYKRNFLLDYLQLNSDESIRQNLLRFRDLYELNVITIEEYLNSQKLLLPQIEYPLIKKPFEFHESKLIKQSNFDRTITFEMLPAQLKYQSKSLLSGGTEKVINYESINLDDQDEIAGEIPIPLYIIGLWFLVISSVILSGIFESNQLGHPHGYYIGNLGAKHALTDFGPPFIMFFVGIWVIDRVTNRRYRVGTITLAYGVKVFIDKYRDKVVDELKKRRSAVFKWYAEPDYLLTLNEQSARIQYLQDIQAINQDEATISMQKMEEFHRQYDLDAPIASSIPTKTDLH